MGKFIDDCGKDGGILGWLLKRLLFWVLFGGPQRKPGKPKKTFAFRLLWFLTSIPMLIILGLFFIAPDGDITKLKPEILQILYGAVAVLFFVILLWILRFKFCSKSNNSALVVQENENNDAEFSPKEKKDSVNWRKPPCPVCGCETETVQGCPECSRVFFCCGRTAVSDYEYVKIVPQYCPDCGTKLYDDPGFPHENNHLQNYSWNGSVAKQYKEYKGHIIYNSKYCD